MRNSACWRSMTAWCWPVRSWKGTGGISSPPGGAAWTAPGWITGTTSHNDYEEAKLDFACRSGLVQVSRQFTDEQLTELYRCIHETLESGYPLAREREDILRTVAERIERSVDDLDARVMRSNEQELAAAQRCPELDGERPESIEIYWQDLTPAKQGEILRAFGENGNYDVFPIATLDVPEEDETFSEQEQNQTPGMDMGMAP